MHNIRGTFLQAQGGGSTPNGSKAIPVAGTPPFRCLDVDIRSESLFDQRPFAARLRVAHCLLDQILVEFDVGSHTPSVRQYTILALTRYRRPPTSSRNCRNFRSSSSGVIPAYFAGRNRRLEASKTASSSMYSSSSTSRLGK